MLILELKKNETVIIQAGDKTIGLMVLKHYKGKSVIGFSAAKDISIVRQSAKNKEPKQEEVNATTEV